MTLSSHKLQTKETKDGYTRKVCTICGDRFLTTAAGWIELDGRRVCPVPTKEEK